jgi:hypothetical protein
LKTTLIKADVFALSNVSEISNSKPLFVTSQGGVYLTPGDNGGGNLILLNDASNKVFALPARTTGIHLEQLHLSPSESNAAVTTGNLEYFFDGVKKNIGIAGSPIHKDLVKVSIGNGLSIQDANGCAYPNSTLSLLIFSELTSEERTSVQSAILEYKSNFFD